MFDNNASFIKPIEFLKIERSKFIAELAMDGTTLIFHFYQQIPLNWPHSEIDILFKETFNGEVKDLTGEFESKMKEIIKKKKAGEAIPTTFMMDIYKEVTSDPSKIHRTFSPMLNSWTYTVKDANEPFVDIKAKKIIDGIASLVDSVNSLWRQ